MMKELEDYKYALDQVAIVALTDANGIILYANENFCKISQYSKEELLGQDHCLINTGELTKDYSEELWVTIKAGNVWQGEIKNRAKDGSLYWVSMTIVPFLNNAGVPYQYLAIRSDISDVKEAEKALTTSLNELSNYKYALDASSIIAITDAQGIIRYVNDNFCKISKYPREELLGQDHRIISSGYHSKEFISELWKTIKAGDIWRNELKNKAKDGTYYWVDTTIVPFLGPNGLPEQYMALRYDITDRKLAEKKLAEKTQSLEYKNSQLLDFCNIVSHNLRGPLINISMLVDFLEESEDPEEQLEILSKIKPVTTHLMDVFNELVESLQVQQDKAIALDKIDLESCLNKVMLGFKTQIEEFGADIIKEIDASHVIYCPKNYMESIVTNLLSNALKYRSLERKPRITITTQKMENAVRLIVRDNGLGLNMALHQHNLFKIRKTFHAHPEAKGFGLFMTKTQVKAIDGKIWAESIPNEGSTFYVEFKNPSK